ncbi:4-hydroxy-tetrahydrodipicolinate reductase [bacterium]|nr:4-hydroxy-tetrahydrodipicolinate reductase [bacterium]
MSSKSPADLSLVVYGSTGRMGQQVLQVAKDLKPSFKKLHGVRRMKDFSESGDVVIDFSLPQAQADLVQYCRDHQVPLVSGTTGLEKKEMENLKALSKLVPVLWAPNMSLGVMVVTRMLKEFKILSDWNYSLFETHHVHKKDKPSGTALRLKEALEMAVGHEVPKVTAFREGEVIGDHKVFAQGEFEEISLEHKATDRRVFAQGSIQAALWLVDQSPGFYSLEDMAITT